jgi:hypothetical protein
MDLGPAAQIGARSFENNISMQREFARETPSAAAICGPREPPLGFLRLTIVRFYLIVRLFSKLFIGGSTSADK